MIKTILKIEGMMCGMCEAHINDAIRKCTDVKKVSSSHKKGETTVISESPLDRDKLEKTIDETGYKLISCSEAPYEKKSLFHIFGGKYKLGRT